MERKTFGRVHIYVREGYNRAMKLADNGNHKEAIEVLVPIVINNPAVPVLFEKLREYEMAYAKKASIGDKLLSFLLGTILAPVILVLTFINPEKAMGLCEKPLAAFVNNPLILNLLASAANAAGAPWVSVTALNVIRISNPANEANLRKLALAMQDNEQAREALKIYQLIARRHPGNVAVQNEVREAMALASIESGNWEEDASTQDKAADTKDAVVQQLLNGTIHDAEQAQMLIDRFQADLAKQESVDMRRKLGDAYMVAGEYEKAYDEYKKVGSMLGILDPVLDKQVEKAYIAQINQTIEELRNNAEAYDNPEQQIAQLEVDRENYRTRHTEDRAQKFPNDIQLQFDLGELYFERGRYDEAIAIFNKTAESPLKHRASLVFLGRCDLINNDGQAAYPKFEEAVNDMYRMDKYKREALYYWGNAAELIGNTQKALDCYKLIKTSISNYRDINERISALTGESAEAPQATDAQ